MLINRKSIILTSIRRFNSLAEEQMTPDLPKFKVQFNERYMEFLILLLIAGILTVRLNYLMKHAEKHKHDYSSKRLIVELLHDRKKHLKYLRRLSLARYFELLDKLGLPHDYLESFDNPYLYRYRTKFHKK